MEQRIFGKTGRAVSAIGLGTWQLGTRWGDPFNHEEAMKILETADAQGIIDTADVYNNGKSEETIGEYIAAHPGRFYITTKCGRRLNPHTAEMYTPAAVAGFIEGSLERMKLERLDMILLHCPPASVYARDDIFGELERLKKAGKIADYGVSIEKVGEGIRHGGYFQHVPPQTPGPSLPPGCGKEHRHYRTRTAGQRHPDRQIYKRYNLRAPGSPDL